jgi:uncharacterized membrane protein YeiH
MILYGTNIWVELPCIICQSFGIVRDITKLQIVEVIRKVLCLEWCLLGCYAVWLLYEHKFRRNLAPPSSG